MDVEAKERPEERRLLVPASKRHATDRFWILLFVLVIVAFCTEILLYVARETPNAAINCDNDTAVNNTSIIKDIADNWKKFTSTFQFLDGNYDDSDTFVIWANVLICTCIIIYSMSLMCENSCNNRHFFTFIYFFMAVHFDEHILLTILLESSNLKWRLGFWWIPDIIFVFIAFAILSHRSVKPERRNDVRELKLDPIPLVYGALFMMIIGSLELIFIFILENLKKHGYAHWHFVIILSIYCYLYLIGYYFTLMAMATSYKTTHICRGFFIVARYHFGTVCYHATFILPRIHATFVVNEKEFRRNPKISATRRLCLTLWKFPHLSPTLTALRGHSHSESVRELLRIFSNDSTNTKDLQVYNQLVRCSYAILLSINNLILISFWAHGVTIESHWSAATWIMYLLSFLLMYIFLRFYDVASDVVWFLNDGNTPDLYNNCHVSSERNHLVNDRQ